VKAKGLLMSSAVVGWKPERNKLRVAGSRVRCLHPLDALQKAGLPIELFQPGRERQYKVVVLQKLFDDEHIQLARTLQAQGTRIVFDLCDNYLYYAPDTPLRDKYEQQARDVARMLEVADVVTVPSEELGRHLSCPSVVVRDGLAPVEAASTSQGARLSSLFGRKVSKAQNEYTELVWYGKANSNRAPAGMRDILRVAEVLETLAKEFSLRLTVISNSREIYEESIRPLKLPTRYMEWQSYEAFSARFAQHDICILPININPYTRCKSNNRLTLSLLLGVPVVADSIPSYEEFGRCCMIGNWYDSLRTYLQNPELRQQHAAAGKVYVRSRYMVDQAAADWWNVFDALLCNRPLYSLTPECAPALP
jgi:glycosyltransferase involved in cell wall biosynthesis